MPSIRAFVGHSFAPTDKVLVKTFLDIFNSIAQLQPEFSWDHAHDAEPKQLSEKVLEKIEDKNLFIGICTAKELAVAAEALTDTWIDGNCRGKKSDFICKTSDWILQEIGLAVGRRMKIILLLEKGVRRPGGLSGDIEYIEFLRNNPHGCSEKLLQMIATLNPRDVTAPAAEAKPVAAPAKETSTQSEDLDPRPDWTSDNYRTAVIMRLIHKDEAEVEKIDSAFKGSVHAHDDGRPIWDAQLEYLRSVFTGDWDLKKIANLVETHPRVGKIRHYLAQGYERLKEHGVAAIEYEKAASLSVDKQDTVENLMHAAVQYRRAGDATKASELIAQAKIVALEHEIKATTLTPYLKEFADIEENSDLHLALMEYEVSNDPSDAYRRFALAYKHSNSENNDLALHHYLRIPHDKRDAMTWNNLGVSFAHFDLPVRSISAYRNSESRGETLAMCNLGYKLLQAGFFDEAKNECNQALKKDDPHKNLAGLLARVNDVRDEEDKKLDVILKKLNSKAKFYRGLGNAALHLAPTTIAKKWRLKDDVFEANLVGAELRLNGTFERPANALAGLLAGIGSGGQKMYTEKIEYKLTLSGDMLTGTVTRSRDGVQPTILGEGLNSGKVLAYFEAPSIIKAMENPHSDSPSFHLLTEAS